VADASGSHADHAEGRDGIAIGLGVSWLASRLLTTSLYEVQPDDPAVLSAIVLLASS
jgi:hypothetical protein